MQMVVGVHVRIGSKNHQRCGELFLCGDHGKHILKILRGGGASNKT